MKTIKDLLDSYEKCKYCGNVNFTQDKDILCKQCQKVFGCTKYSEL